MNDQVVFKTVQDLVSGDWLDVSDAPNYFSFRCLIRFAEHGYDGPTQPYIGTGMWWHQDEKFVADQVEYRRLTPEKFIPLYDCF